jgi:hypothetical protein
MENNVRGKDKTLSPQEETAKAALLAECDKLAKAGVTFVAAHFDGYGDDGTTEEVKCYGSELYARTTLLPESANAEVSQAVPDFPQTFPAGDFLSPEVGTLGHSETILAYSPFIRPGAPKSFCWTELHACSCPFQKIWRPVFSSWPSTWTVLSIMLSCSGIYRRFTGGFARNRGLLGHSVRTVRSMQNPANAFPSEVFSEVVDLASGDVVQLVRTLPCRSTSALSVLTSITCTKALTGRSRRRTLQPWMRLRRL